MSNGTVPRARSVLSRLGLIATVVAIGLTTAVGTAAAQQEQAVPELEVTAEFDKQSYTINEEMRIRVEITNVGTETATDIARNLVDGSHEIQTDYLSWGVLNTDMTIAPGETLAADVTGRVRNHSTTTAVLSVHLFVQVGPEIGKFTFPVSIRPKTGQVAGSFYTDRNDNAFFDQGESLGGAEVRLFGTGATYTTTTDSSGHFAFPQVPVGPAALSATAPDGWLVGERKIVVDESADNENLLLRAARPITDLTAMATFDEDVYLKGEIATVTITLTNAGDRPLAGIIADCNRAGSGNGLDGTGPGWGDLAGAGVTIDAHSTLTLVVSEAVPNDAVIHGSVHVRCGFTYAGVEGPRPTAPADSARVPGGFGPLRGQVNHGTASVADVRVVLLRDGLCPIVAETTTNAAGEFDFGTVPAGEYDAYLFTPTGWRIEYSNPSRTYVMANYPSQMYISAIPGDAAPPTLPADCAAN